MTLGTGSTARFHTASIASMEQGLQYSVQPFVPEMHRSNTGSQHPKHKVQLNREQHNWAFQTATLPPIPHSPQLAYFVIRARQYLRHMSLKYVVVGNHAPHHEPRPPISTEKQPPPT